MIFTVTPLYALPLAAIFLALWFRVSAIRSATGISFGDEGNLVLLRRVRQHGNFVEWVSIVLILMMLADGVMVSGEGLQGIETATSLRIRGGKVETMDGPFATTKEHLGGYYVINVPDLDAALRYAGMMPVAQWGTVEVRPLMDYNPVGQ